MLHLTPYPSGTLTEEQADLAVLGLANERRRLVAPVGDILPDPIQQALERAQDNCWVTLIDVTRIAEFGPGAPIFRVFRLSDSGMRRLAAIRVLSS